MGETDLRSLRRKLLTVAYESGEPTHLASSLSVLKIIWTLYDKVLGPSDTFILSKGHAALALYVVLNAKGIISDELLATFGKPGSTLYGHPCVGTPGIYTTTGSLGHGICVAVGAAYAKQIQHGIHGPHVYCLVGDGEISEGSCYEALCIARRLNLGTLTVIVDVNEPERSRDAERFARAIYPHHTFTLATGSRWDMIDALNPRRPITLITTPKGHGIPAMEADPQGWHRRKMTEAEYLAFIRYLHGGTWRDLPVDVRHSG